MKGHMTVIEPTGGRWEEELETVPGLERLQGIVGGSIERVPAFKTHQGKRCVAYFNEDGQRLGLMSNSAARREWAQATSNQIPRVLGPMIILTGDKDFMEAL